MRRITSIDTIRGLVMVVMALDHTRDFLHASTVSATNLAVTTPELFMTRWITHLCAPTFVFLSGTSAFLSMQRSGDIPQARRFLISRGLWLILLECTFVNFTLWTDIHFRILFLQVIFAIGAGFIILAFLLRVPARWLLVIGLGLIAGHDLIRGPGSSVLTQILTLPFLPVAKQVTSQFLLDYHYPVLPWFGIMLTGFACGNLFLREDRAKWFVRIGLCALILFVLLRWINGYGDPAPWSQQKDALFTVLSFINVTKYPPSLLYTLLMLGLMFLLLAVADGRTGRFARVAQVYGKVPMFYYLLHIPLVHLAMFIMVFAQGFHASDLVFGPFLFGRPASGSGISLFGVYLVWLAIVALLYPLCRVYGRYKAAHPEKTWLRYF